MERIILFDGVCNLCNQSVQFIIKRDPKAHFTFASLESDSGKKLLRKLGMTNKMDSFVLIENGKGYTKSSAALKVCLKLKGLWKLFAIFYIIPFPVRDWVYDIVAKHRYKWFGKRENCMLATPEDKKRFL